jgi:hypothetical protein
MKIKGYKDYLLLACVLLLTAAVLVIIRQDHRIAEVKYNAKEYEEKIYGLDVKLETRAKRIEELERELANIDTDDQIIYDNPVEPVDVNSDWSALIQILRVTVDSTE